MLLCYTRGWGDQGKPDARSYKGRERRSFTSAKSVLFPSIVKNVAVTCVQPLPPLPKGCRVGGGGLGGGCTRAIVAITLGSCVRAFFLIHLKRSIQELLIDIALP